MVGRIYQSWSLVLSNPVLAPNPLGLFAAVELELDGDDIIKALVQRWCAEAAAEVAEGDAGEGGSGFGVLVGMRM